MPSDIPADTSTTTTLRLGTTLYGSIETVGDHDWIRVELEAGKDYQVRLHGVGQQELDDPFLELFDANGSSLGTLDDYEGGWGGPNVSDPFGSINVVASGTYYLDVSSFVQGSTNDDTGDYILTVAEGAAGSQPVQTYDEIAWQLTTNFQEFFDYGSAIAFNLGADRRLTYNVTKLTAEGAALAEAALDAWSEVTGIEFVAITSGRAELNFDDSDSGTDAYTSPNVRGSQITSSDIMITTGWLTEFGTGFGSYSFETYIHEIGHALGLGHGGNYNGTIDDNYYANDSIAYSIMSYVQAANDEFTQDGPSGNPNVDASFRYMQTMSIVDIIAIQYLYGDQVQTSTRLGNTTYGFGSNTGNAALDAAVTFGADMFMCVYDDGGIDTLDFSGATVSQTITLASGSFSDVLGGKMNLAIARGVVIENAIGGTRNDQLTGNGRDNILDGGAGTDTMRGMTGNDTYIVDRSTDRVFEAVGAGTDQVRASVSYALMAGQEVETLSTTNATGTSAIDLTGNAFAQELIGNAGDNVLNGLAGADTMRGLGGNDTYIVERANDRVFEAAGGGTDKVIATTSYTLLGGQEIETLQLAASTGDSTFNLTGNGSDQTLIGNAGANRLDGGGGADVLRGLDGNDTYLVDMASDRVFELTGQGNDTVIASVSYTLQANQSVETLRLANPAGTAALELTGNNLANTIQGNAGANVINGGGGADRLFGYAGSDTFVFDTALGPNDIDRIVDFSVPADTIRLDRTVFTELSLGGLSPAAFKNITTGVVDGNDRILYDSDSGALFYDADGSGADGRIQFATLENRPANLSAVDFFVVA